MDFDVYQDLNGLADRHHTLADAFRFFAQDRQLLFIALLAGLFFVRQVAFA